MRLRMLVFIIYLSYVYCEYTSVDRLRLLLKKELI